MRSPVTTLATLVALTLVASCGTSLQAQVSRHETSNEHHLGAEPLGPDGEPTLVIVRVLDHVTGAPIADAGVSLVREIDPWIDRGDAVAAHGRTDAWGWARVGVGDLAADDWSWIFVDAPGYGPFGAFSRRLDDPVELVPGRPSAFACLDARGRPVPDVRLDLLVGCGHTPAVRSARSGADGLGVLDDVARPTEGIFEVFSHGTDIVLEAHEAPDPAASSGTGARHVLILERRPSLQGRVVDGNGDGVAGVLVGAPVSHRGPWTTSDAEGRFRLQAPPGGMKQVLVAPTGATEDRGVFTAVEVLAPPAGVSLVLRVDGGVLVAPLDGPEFVVAAADEAGPLGGLVVTLYAPEDGRTARGLTDPDGELRLLRPASTALRVRIEDPGRRHAVLDRALRPDELAASRAEVRPVPHPTLRIALDVPGDLDHDVAVIAGDGTLVRCALEDESDGTDDDAAGDPVTLSGELAVPGPDAVLRVRSEVEGGVFTSTFALPADRGEARARHRPSILRIERLLGPDDRPVEAVLRLQTSATPDEGTWLEILDGLEASPTPDPKPRELRVPREAGALWLIAVPLDPALEPLRVPLRRVPALPLGVGDDAEAGEGMLEALEGPAERRVIDALRFPHRDDVAVRVAAPAAARSGGFALDVHGLVRADADPDGTWKPRVLGRAELAGRWITVRDPGPPATDDGPSHVRRVPLRAALPGAPPFVLTWPRGVVEIRVPPFEDGRHVVAMLDGEDHGTYLRDGRLRLEGVARGAHRLVLAARGMRSEVFDVDVGDTPVRIDVTWTPRGDPGR